MASELPLEVIQSEILPRLPAASACRFKCVSKQWQSFLSTHDFESLHSCHARSKLATYDARSRTFLMCECESPENGQSTAVFLPFKVRSPDDVKILASLDGLICACIVTTKELVLWNPTTHAYNKLSNSKSQGYIDLGDAVGLYVDADKDYKILHIKQRRRRGRDGISVSVYSRRLDSWRKIKFVKKPSRFLNYVWSRVIFCGDSLYFTVKEWCIGGKSWIIGFDVNSEKFREIRFPCVPYDASYNGFLLEIRNCIHLLVSYGMEENMLLHSHLDLWKMEDDGGGEKWIKLASVSGIENVPWEVNHVTRNGNWIVIQDIAEDVYKVDIKRDDKALISNRYCGVQCFPPSRTMIYMETLVSPSILKEPKPNEEI